MTSGQKVFTLHGILLYYRNKTEGSDYSLIAIETGKKCSFLCSYHCGLICSVVVRQAEALRDDGGGLLGAESGML